MKEFLEFDSEEQDLIQRVSRLEEELYRARLALKLHRERCQMARKRRLEEIDEGIKVLALERQRVKLDITTEGLFPSLPQMTSNDPDDDSLSPFLKSLYHERWWKKKFDF